MSGAMNRLMAGYRVARAGSAPNTLMPAAAGGLLPSAPQAADDWAMRLPTRPDRPWQPDVDHPMIVQPGVDPGYQMPNPPVGNLNAMPGVEVPGWLPVNATQAQQPDPRTDPAGYQNWLRVMLQRGAT